MKTNVHPYFETRQGERTFFSSTEGLADEANIHQSSQYRKIQPSESGHVQVVCSDASEPPRSPLLSSGRSSR